MIPTEPIGSIPRPPELIRRLRTSDEGAPELEQMFERIGSPVIGTELASKALAD